MEWLNKLRNTATDAKKVVFHRETAEAALGMMTLVGHGNGAMDHGEYEKMEAIYAADETLKAFPYKTLEAKQNELASKYRVAKIMGERGCIKELKDIRGVELDVRERIAVLGLAMVEASSAADQDSAKKACRLGIEALGLKPEDWGV